MSAAGADFDAARQLFLQGLAHQEAGRPAEAVRCYERSLALLPGRASTQLNLAAAHNQLGRHADALHLLDDLLARDAGDADAHWQRGLALAALQRSDAALRDFEQATSLRAGWPEAWWYRADMLHRLGRLTEALACCERALALDPARAVLHTQRGSLLRELGRRDEAADAFRQALAAGGDAELNRWYLAALGAEPAPDGAPALYVRSLFDDYADGFEQHLVQQLGYRGHVALAESIERVAPGRRFASALDLGCGSGLCGALLRARVRRLAGVDLSAQMVARARRSGHYDEVLQADVAEHLARTEARHDLVVAADVFIYVGRLEAVFAGVARVLEPGGLFSFTLEKLDPSSGGEDLRVTDGLRYAHAEAYVRRLAGSHGMPVLDLRTEMLRREQTRPIDGLVVTLGAGG